MRLFIPYASVYLIDHALEYSANELQIKATGMAMGRPKIRNRAPGVPGGVPHWEYKVRLFPISGSDHLRKFSRYNRRINGVCWDGHARFMARMFDHFPSMTLRSSGGPVHKNGQGNNCTCIQYAGVDDFISNYGSTRGQAWNSYVSCNCVARPGHPVSMTY